MQKKKIKKIVEDYFETIGYKSLDPFKKMCQQAISRTLFNNKDIEFEMNSLGESCLIAWQLKNKKIERGLGLVIEGLGTKGIVAEEVYKLTGKTYGFKNIAKDTFAMIVNDMVTSGCLPIMANMYLGIGHPDWMLDKKRSAAIIAGWEEYCKESGVIWMGGETPTLRGIIAPEYFDICGTGFGHLESNNYLHGSKIVSGDRIILIGSSGIHANGLTDARKVATHLSREGYMTEISAGLTYGEVLLQPTVNYVPLMRSLQEHGITSHYAVNITGHAWAKLMRAKESFKYVIEQILTPQPEFGVIKDVLKYKNKQMYNFFNMGAGFAIYASKESVDNILLFAKQLGLNAIDAGYIKSAKEKSVNIKPVNVKLTELDIR